MAFEENGDPAALWGKLDGVIQQVVQDMSDFGAIGQGPPFSLSWSRHNETYPQTQFASFARSFSVTDQVQG
ncbi:MAG: hypothetical protein M1299_02565, partial [Firmicutes bacterium]|nr:hypothetical protein [Bacillota bacterium]